MRPSRSQDFATTVVALGAAGLIIAWLKGCCRRRGDEPDELDAGGVLAEANVPYPLVIELQEPAPAVATLIARLYELPFDGLSAAPGATLNLPLRALGREEGTLTPDRLEIKAGTTFVELTLTPTVQARGKNLVVVVHVLEESAERLAGIASVVVRDEAEDAAAPLVYAQTASAMARSGGRPRVKTPIGIGKK